MTLLALAACAPASAGVRASPAVPADPFVGPAAAPTTPNSIDVASAGPPVLSESPPHSAPESSYGPNADNPTNPLAPPPSTTAPIEPDGAAVVTMAFSGDILPHSPLWQGAARHAAAAGHDGHDFAPMLAALTPIHNRVDLAVCHLETPIAPAGEAFSTMPFYGVPAEIADAIAAAHFDRCSTASNHTFDRGVAGIERTVAELERAGVDQDGMAAELADVAPQVFRLNGVAIAHLSYTYSYNGIIPPEADAWRSRLIDPARILGDAGAARNAGAELVILSLHWGAEGQHEPTPQQRELAEQLTASGLIDLIVGHHAHVVQPIEQVNGVWVIYGLGNILSNMPTGSFPPASQDGAVATIAVHRDAGGHFTWLPPAVIPTWVDRHDGWRIRVVTDELARTGLNAGRRAVLQESFNRTAAVVGEYIDHS